MTDSKKPKALSPKDEEDMMFHSLNDHNNLQRASLDAADEGF